MPKPAAETIEPTSALASSSPRLLLSLLLLAGITAYSNTFAVPFFFDDLSSISENPHIEKLWPIEVPPRTTLDSRPAVAFTLALNFAFGDRNPGGYHLFNLLLHLLNGVLLFGIVRRVLGSAPLALAVSLLWLLHPLQTEAVTYVIQRTELMMAFSMLLALYALVRASEETRWATGFAALAILSCALGMASKEVMVTAPLLLLLFDRIYLAGSWRALWAKRRLLHLGTASSWGILLLLVYHTPRQASAGFHFASFGPWDYAQTQVSVVLHYLRLAIFPHPLVIDYGNWQLASKLWQPSILGAALLLALLGATAWSLLRRPKLGFLGAWFFVILAPTSSILPIITEPAAERRVYLPLAAVVVLALLGLRALLLRLLPQQRPRLLVSTLLVLGLGAVFLARTHQRNESYRDRLTIWTLGVAQLPQNPRARLNLGVAYLDLRQSAKALPQLREALRLDPNYAAAHTALGGALGQLGQLPEAERHLRLAIKLDPRDHRAHGNLGAVFAQTGRPKRAVAQLERARHLGGARADTLLNLAQARAMLGDFARAERDARAALKRRPNDTGALQFLAKLLVRSNRLSEANAIFRRALKLRGNDAALWNNAGVALARAGKLEAAIGYFRQSLRLAPKYADAQRNLQRALQARSTAKE